LALFERDFGAALGAALATTLGATFTTLATGFLEEDLAGLTALTGDLDLEGLGAFAMDLTGEALI